MLKTNSGRASKTASAAGHTKGGFEMINVLRAIYTIWLRELLRWWRDHSRIIGAFGFPIIFLFIFGSGLSPAMGGLTAGLGMGGNKIDFVKFIFPGVIGMNVLMASIMSGVSIVWDREFGVLKEMLVAPVSRPSVAIGKTLGGATVATLQGLLILVFAPLINVHLSFIEVIQLIPLMFLGALSLTAMGVAIAARMHSMEGFQMIMQFVTFPMIFMSGALFPLRNLPGWMNFLVKINPVTYAIDPLRQVIMKGEGVPAFLMAKLAELGLTVEVLGHPMTIWNDVLVVSVFGLVMVVLSVSMFNIRD